MSEQTNENENPAGEQDADQDVPQNEDVQERTQGQSRPRYIDPNSGAAPQPGGFAVAPVVDGDPEAKADNVTMPEEAREPQGDAGADGASPQDQGIQELPDELVRSQSLDTELQNQATPSAPQPGAEDLGDEGQVGNQQPGTSPESTGEADAGTQTDADSTEETEGVEEPAGNAGLDEWQAYAKSKGATDEDLEGKGRNDLRDQYGSK
jgi:hypothetical protein